MGKICGPMDRNTMDDQKPLLADMVKCRRYRPLIYQLDRWNPLMSWRDTPLFCFQAAYPITSSIRVIVDKEVRYRHRGTAHALRKVLGETPSNWYSVLVPNSRLFLRYIFVWLENVPIHYATSLWMKEKAQRHKYSPHLVTISPYLYRMWHAHIRVPLGMHSHFLPMCIVHTDFFLQWTVHRRYVTYHYTQK